MDENNNKGGQIPSVPTINPKPDDEEIWSKTDPEYQDERGDLGSMPETGADITEEDTAALASEVGIHSENDHQGGIDPLTDAEDINMNAEDE